MVSKDNRKSLQTHVKKANWTTMKDVSKNLQKKLQQTYGNACLFICPFVMAVPA